MRLGQLEDKVHFQLSIKIQERFASFIRTSKISQRQWTSGMYMLSAQSKTGCVGLIHLAFFQQFLQMNHNGPNDQLYNLYRQVESTYSIDQMRFCEHYLGFLHFPAKKRRKRAWITEQIIPLYAWIFLYLHLTTSFLLGSRQ